MDYQKYMSQGNDKKGNSQGGDYQQYMDYQKYMPQGGGKGGSQGGDYTQYYQKYMSQGGGKNLSDANINLVSSDSNRLPHDNSGGYAKFYKDYVPMVKNWSNREEVNAAFTKRYAGSYVPAPSPAKSSDASASASAPAIALAASIAPSVTKSSESALASAPVNDIANATLALATSDTSADAPPATKTVLAAETSSRKGWHGLLFLATVLPAVGVVLQTRSFGSFASMKMLLLQKLRGDQTHDDMSGYHLQTEKTNEDMLV